MPDLPVLVTASFGAKIAVKGDFRIVIRIPASHPPFVVSIGQFQLVEGRLGSPGAGLMASFEVKIAVIFGSHDHSMYVFSKLIRPT